MVQVCERTKTKREMEEQTVDQYKEVFIKAKRDFQKIVEVRFRLFTRLKMM